MQIKIPEQAEIIISQLEKEGYEAYVVGGCVRDALLGRTPEDWDVTTSAPPHEIKRIFKRTVDTGIAHGTVTVMIEHNGYEVTTYRIDGEYEDNRHPKEISYTNNLEEDLARRDFTINALAYHPEKGLVDRFLGLSDMKHKIIRCVGNAMERFGEDALRILRALRFSAQLDFSIDQGTKDAMTALAPNLQSISAERIRAELCKLLLSDHPEKILDAYEFRITRIILPEIDHIIENYDCPDAARTLRSIKRLNRCVKEKPSLLIDRKFHQVLMLILLFHHSGSNPAATAKTVLRRLKFDNDTIQKTIVLLSNINTIIPPEKPAIRYIANRIGPDFMPYLLFIKRVILESDHTEDQYTIKILDKETALYEEIIQNRDCLTLKSLAITGNDLLQIGFRPGKILGDTLQDLLNEVLKIPEKNTHAQLLEHAKLKLNDINSNQ